LSNLEMFWSASPPSVLSADHGYVILALVATWFVHNGVGASKVMKARKEFDVQYPSLYAEGSSAKAKAFNCVQRGHQNSLEGLPNFLALLLSASLVYPRASAVAAAVYNVGVVLYMNGYATGDPKNRSRGAVKYLGLLFLLGANVRIAVNLLLGW